MKYTSYYLKVAAIKNIMKVYGIGTVEAIHHYNSISKAARDNNAFNYIISESGAACAK